MDLLKENDEFHSWEEWKSRFDEWCQATGQQYKVNTSRTVSSYNKGRDMATQKREGAAASKGSASSTKSAPELAPKVDDRWQFVYVRYLCVHNNRHSNKQPTISRNCKASVVVKYERKMDCILLFKLDPSHEHADRAQSSASGASQGSGVDAINQSRTETPQPQVSPISVSTSVNLQQQAQGGHSQDDVGDDSLDGVGEATGEHDITAALDGDELVDDSHGISHPQASPIPASGLGSNIAVSVGTEEEPEPDDDLGSGPPEGYRALSLQQLTELPEKLTLRGDPAPVHILIQELHKLNECDPDSSSSVIVSTTSFELVAVFFQTGHMKRKFALYPEILLFDAGYHFAMNPDFSLVSFSGHDAQGLGGPFAFAILMKPIRLMAGLLLTVFIGHNQPAARDVHCILLDREQHRRLKNSLSTLFEGAKCVLYCHFHVVRSMLKEMTRLELPPLIQEKICKTLRGMFSGLQEKNYNEHLKKLDQIEPRFAKYFNTQWHPTREMWAGFRREGMVPFANGMNDRVEVLSQFMSLVCERSQTLSDALCNLVYAVTGIIEQTNTERLLCDIREYHMKMVEHEARLISLCSDYAALHVLTQVRISRTYKFSVTQTSSESTYLVSSVAGKGSVQPGRGFACSCSFYRSYQLPCSHAFVVAIAHGIPMQDSLVVDKWRRTDPFPVDVLPADLTAELPASEMKYSDKLNKMKEVTNALATLAAVSTQSDFNNMYSIVSQMYKVWTRNSGHKITLNVAAPGTGKSQIVNVGVSLGDEEDMDLANGSSKHLKDDDPSLNFTMSSVVGVKGVGSSSGGVVSNVAVFNKLAAPDDAVFSFTGGTLSSGLGVPLADSGHLEEYGDLNCFTAPSGGPVESTANMNLFEDLPAGGRENSPVLLSIKDEEDSKDDDSSKVGVGSLKWDQVENYKLLDSIIAGHDITMDEPDK
ncbi:uncharacterized protein LOC111261403 isoform X2 [Varroa jacobsoni]|uniref:SWIM-type domain-containing protein n=1 Tax=Varroa destructor TaxID=109461 RepID=A0A7M7J4Z3_VARDE|nr:uncharacterized protein LOC111244105 isoform X2 [Varroa destructor]XP_022690598.1 uncharacterized protein LOC111261403 isoform X2 [Varroa jacobsoni]